MPPLHACCTVNIKVYTHCTNVVWKVFPADKEISGVTTTIVGHQGSLRSYQPGQESQHMTVILWQDTVALYTCKQNQCVEALTYQAVIWFYYCSIVLSGICMWVPTYPLNMCTQICSYMAIYFVSRLQTISCDIGYKLFVPLYVVCCQNRGMLGTLISTIFARVQLWKKVRR